MVKNMIAIAIDGPSGAGKSTIARLLAKEFKFLYVDTGALYRAIGLYMLQKEVGLTENERICSLLPEISLKLEYINGEQRVLLNGIDVSDEIRKPEISMAASAVSAIPKVREFLLDLQRSIALTNNVIMDGRDIATVVLPNAQIKIFLSASAEDRAKRRYLELKQKGIECDFQQVYDELKVRDYNDSNREVAPLKPSPESIQIDTSGYTLEQSIETIKEVIINRLKEISNAERELQ